MKTITFAALLDQVGAKKGAIGWVDEEATTNALRHSCVAHTAAKREMLTRIEQNTVKLGCAPLKSNYANSS